MEEDRVGLQQEATVPDFADLVMAVVGETATGHSLSLGCANAKLGVAAKSSPVLEGSPVLEADCQSVSCVLFFFSCLAQGWLLFVVLREKGRRFYLSAMASLAARAKLPWSELWTWPSEEAPPKQLCRTSW
jgi:hypothetical protein